MSRVRKELDRMSDEAKDELAGDVRKTATRLVRVGAACTRKHPVLVLGGGALLAALAVWRLGRPAPVVVECPHAAPKRVGWVSKLFRMGRFGLAWALSFASKRAENPRTREPDSPPEGQV